MELAPLLEGIWSALEEQTWLMQQMWSTHTAVELELWLLHHGMDFMLNQVYWVGEGEREVEQKGASERGGRDNGVDSARGLKCKKCQGVE